MDPVLTSPERIPELLERHAAVSRVRLAGSRQRGEALPLSDWDFILEVTDLELVKEDIGSLVEELAPLAHQWDPLSDRWNYMVMLDGPTKVDLIIEQPHDLEPPWEPTEETLPRIEHHFWDWTLWLASKSTRGRRELVAGELGKMFHNLLAPMGVRRAPPTIEEAVESYAAARDARELTFDVRVPREIERQARTALRRAGFDVAA
jgi:predicted nucleotidyltransferase